MKKIKNENKQVYLRILVICSIDIICGIIVCVVGLMYYFDFLITLECSVSNFKCFNHRAPIVVIVLFSLNNIINPYIYCFHLLQNLLKCCKTQVKKMNSTIQVAIKSLACYIVQRRHSSDSKERRVSNEGSQSVMKKMAVSSFIPKLL